MQGQCSNILLLTLNLKLGCELSNLFHVRASHLAWIMDYATATILQIKYNWTVQITQ